MITNIGERIAEEVRKHPHLYDTSLKDYKDPGKAANTWRAISAVVELDTKDCVLRWRRLRDKFVRAKRTFNSRSGDAGGQKIPAVLTFLSWLDPFVKHRETSSNVDNKTQIQRLLQDTHVLRPPSQPNKQTEPLCREETAASAPEASPESSSPSPEASVEPTTPPPSRMPPFPSTPQASKPIVPLSPRTLKRRRAAEDQSVLEAMARIEERRAQMYRDFAPVEPSAPPPPPPPPPQCEFTCFGNCVGVLAKTLHKDKQREIQLQIFTLLYDNQADHPRFANKDNHQ